MIDGGATLARRLDRYRSAIRAPTRDAAAPPTDDLAGRLAAAVDGEIVRTSDGVIVRLETPSRAIPVDRALLATLPGQPPADVPLVCLDTETTGLATAAGTLAWLIGVGWWEADRFRQVQLLLPDNGEERCLLAALEATIPASAWLVTYNGRGFDWPLLVARYRLARRAAPVHAGHLDLLPVVRRLFRHRMADARLRTAEAELLGLHRVGDVEGWEIPGRYLEFLRGGPAEPLVDIVRHNDQDVRSLARLLMLIANEYATPEARRTVPIGDLGGLATAYAREGRLDEALACYDVAIRGPAEPPPRRPTAQASRAARPGRAASCRGGRPAWRPTSAAHDRRRSRPAGRSGRRPSRARGRPTGSPSSEPTCCAGSSAGTRRWTPGRVSRRDPVGPPSWPRSSSPRSVSIGCATRWAPCTSRPTPST